MDAKLKERIQGAIGRAFARGTPYHGLIEIERLLDEVAEPAYVPWGKQVVRDGKIVAQCEDEETAAALTGFPYGEETCRGNA